VRPESKLAKSTLMILRHDTYAVGLLATVNRLVGRRDVPDFLPFHTFALHLHALLVFLFAIIILLT